MQEQKDIISQIDRIAMMLYKNESNSLEVLEASFQNICNMVLETCKSLKEAEAQEVLEILKNFIQAYEQKNVIQLGDILRYQLENKLVSMNCIDADSINNTVAKQYLNLNENFYIQNLEALKEVQGEEICERIKNYCNKYKKLDDETLLMDINCNIEVKQYNHWWRLNSQYDLQTTVGVWTENMTDINYKSIVMVCGMSNGEYIRQILGKLGKENMLLVYEPDERIFALNVLYNDMHDILSDKRCIFFSENINMDIFDEIFKDIFGYASIELLKLYSLPVYDVIYRDKIEQFIGECRKKLDSIALVTNTIILKNEKVVSNIIKNLIFAMKATSLNQLREQFTKTELETIPAIIVAAGPSLDKNIAQLKAVKNKAFIIGVDSSLRMLLKHNIMPDVVVTIDVDKERVLFEDERTDDIPIVFCMHSTFDILEKNKSKKILFSNTNYISKIFKELDKNICELDSGGSVANTAFAVAMYLGFKNIIMIGQDLAFTNNKKHASVVYEEKGISEEEKDMYEMVEGIDGKPILTYSNFRVYRDWYEVKIEQAKDRTIINATEGGAMIHGAVNMALEDALKKYCSNCVDKDYAGMIHQCSPFLETEEQQKFKSIIVDTVCKCDSLISQFQLCKKYYQDIIQGTDQDGSGNERQFSKNLTRINKIIEQCDKEAIMEFISYYARKDELDAQEGLYSTEDNRKSVAQKGILVLDSYIAASEKVKEKYVELITRNNLQ